MHDCLLQLTTVYTSAKLGISTPSLWIGRDILKKHLFFTVLFSSSSNLAGKLALTDVS